MREVDLSIVTFRPDLALLQKLLASLAEPLAQPTRRRLFIQDNSPEPEVTARIEALPETARGGAFETVDIARSESNVGFGRGHNANAARGSARFLFVLNQDCVLEPGTLGELLAHAEADDPKVGTWELRQIPYEHPKDYDPVTLDTSWCSGAALLVRREAFDSIGGFDPRLFMYGEDVDFSWRLRAKGWRLGYRPRFAVVHRTYAHANEVKPLQLFGSVLANLCLRARFGGMLRTLQGVTMLVAEIAGPQSFPGRRKGLVQALARFFARWFYFARTSVRPTDSFKPFFAGWGYEMRRDGAFHEFTSHRENPSRDAPLVSILIRTVDRPAWLREALTSCANQTYRNLEVVVIEDGPERSRAIVEDFADRMAIRYRSTGGSVGRARAGNLALREARGEWLNFLDDDDLFFADHVEVLVESARHAGVAGAYALAWETQTRFIDRSHAHYEEVVHLTRHRQRFDRLTLWHHNYLPIQAVLFHRRLWERYGGFEEDMDQLEDWNLWTRYTLDEDFLLVEKTTSKYRVPFDVRDAAERQVRLDKAYADALQRQQKLLVTLSPREITRMADAYARSHALMVVTESDVRRLLGSSRLFAKLAAYRRPAGRVLRRWGWIK
jgi:GT2 family glycosyltransferase